MIGLEGTIRTGSFTNKDGQKVYTTDIWVDRVEFVGSKGSGTANQTQQKTDFMNIPDGIDEEEGLPF